MVAYDTLVWREGKGAETSLAGVTSYAAGNPSYTVSGDYIEAKKGNGQPFITRIWGYSATKMTGVALSGNRSRFQSKFLGPGSSNALISAGMVHNYKLKFQEGEQISGWSASNADEMDLLCADISYGTPNEYPEDLNQAVRAAGVSEVFCVDCTITTTTGSFTAADGSATLDAISQDDTWIDNEARYVILGVQPNIGLSNGGGALVITGLGGEWTGRRPAIPFPEQSAVTFDLDKPVFAPNGGIPFQGDALPSMHILAAAAAATKFGLFVGKK